MCLEFKVWGWSFRSLGFLGLGSEFQGGKGSGFGFLGFRGEGEI